MSSANTPMNDPPGSQEDQQYLEKVKQLEKYIEPLRKMIAGIGNEDQNKLDKMKKLMDILSNPSKRMPMETLLKCEKVLGKMNFQLESSSAEASASSASSSSLNPLLEAIINLKKNNPGVNLNHALQKSFGPPLEAIYGSEMTLPQPPHPRKRRRSDSPSPDELPFALQSEIRRLRRIFKVTLDPAQPTSNLRDDAVSFVCELDDPNLPSVPPITVVVPPRYPEVSPACETEAMEADYTLTPFLKRVHDALVSRLRLMPDRFTLSQLMGAWEMSVRAACSPRQVEATQAAALLGI